MRSARSCEETFEFLSDVRNDAAWFPDFLDGGWEGDGPRGVGSRRWFRSDLLWLREEFVVWAPPLRFAFIGIETSLPLMSRFGESYTLDPGADGGCDVRWTVRYTPRAPLYPLHPIVRPYFQGVFDVAARALSAALSPVVASTEPSKASMLRAVGRQPS